MFVRKIPQVREDSFSRGRTWAPFLEEGIREAET
jgi:hypothetical protein